MTVPPQRLFFAGTPSPRHATHAIRTQVDPDVYVVLDEKLFLFSNAEARTAFENEEPGIVQVADGKWTEMESERLCGNQNFTARSTRRLLDGVAMPFPHTSGFHAGERAQKKGCFSCF